MTENQDTESARLERLWGGRFGNEYIERNRTAGDRRSPFWQALKREFPAPKVLEVGCNLGANLQWLADGQPDGVYGIDINETALNTLRNRVPAAQGVLGNARGLPFRDGAFDLVFTIGVLIHQPESSLGAVMREMRRCSRRYVLCGEYFAEETVEVPYRGQTGALFKRDYGAIFEKTCPDLKLVRRWLLTRDEGWDDVTVWLFRC